MNIISRRRRALIAPARSSVGPDAPVSDLITAFEKLCLRPGKTCARICGSFSSRIGRTVVAHGRHSNVIHIANTLFECGGGNGGLISLFPNQRAAGQRLRAENREQLIVTGLRLRFPGRSTDHRCPGRGDRCRMCNKLIRDRTVLRPAATALQVQMGYQDRRRVGHCAAIPGGQQISEGWPGHRDNRSGYIDKKRRDGRQASNSTQGKPFRGGRRHRRPEAETRGTRYLDQPARWSSAALYAGKSFRTGRPCGVPLPETWLKRAEFKAAIVARGGSLDRDRVAGRGLPSLRSSCCTVAGTCSAPIGGSCDDDHPDRHNHPVLAVDLPETFLPFPVTVAAPFSLLTSGSPRLFNDALGRDRILTS